MPAPRLTILLASVLAALACRPGNRGRIGVSAKGAGTPAVASVDVAPGIAVDRVRVVVKKLELEGEGESGVPAPMPMMPVPMARTADQGGDDGEDGEGEAEIGPVVIDVKGPALTGKVTHVFDADVPEGVFGELEILVAPVSGLLGTASILVDGTKDGADFTFATSLVARQELETRIVVDHAGKSANVTLVLDVKSWFTAADGTALDPTVDANRPAIEANMLANLRFERDDDEDGVDDEH